MKYVITILFISGLFFSCTKNNEPEPAIPANDSKINLSIGIHRDTDLKALFDTINSLHFDIREMHGFDYLSDIPESGIGDLKNLLNSKPYINYKGIWPAYVFFSPTYRRTLISNIYFEMNIANQTDLLNTISSLRLVDMFSDNKYLALSVPVGKQSYWKDQMKKYSFVTWTETYDQICDTTVHTFAISANVPSSGTVNQIIPIAITFGVVDGCGGFGKITEVDSVNTKILKLHARYRGCVCTQAGKILQTTYNFKPATTGTHTIRFIQPNGDRLNYIINIQ